MTEIHFPNPSYVDDGIIFKVSSDGYEMIRLDLYVDNEIYSLEHRLYDEETTFDLRELLRAEGKLPTLSGTIAEDKIYTEWEARIYGIIDGEETEIEVFEGYSFQGSAAGASGNFLTQYSERTIGKGDDILVYCIVEPGENTFAIFYDEKLIEYNIETTLRTVRIYISGDETEKYSRISIINPAGEKISYTIEEKREIEKNGYIFRNRAGGYERIWLYGEVKRSIDSKYKLALGNDGEYKKYNIEKDYVVEKKILPDEICESLIDEIILSDAVWEGEKRIIIEEKKKTIYESEKKYENKIQYRYR